MKVLLAEDNPLILDHFVRMTNWKEYGFGEILTAVDGRRAWALAEKYHPELVITDIQMPRMNGIELAEQLRKNLPDTLIYFLTSYEEFSYVKAGLELGICGYLLKHETKREDLEKLLKEVKKEIKKRRLHGRYMAEAALHELIRSTEAEENTAEKDLMEYEISLPDTYDLLWLEQDHIYPVFEELFGAVNEKRNSQALVNVCYRLDPEIAAVVQTGDWNYICLVKSRGSSTELAYTLKKRLEEQCNAIFSVLILADQSSITACAERYRRTTDIRRQKIFRPADAVAHAGSISHSRKIIRPLELKKADEWIKEREFEQLSIWMDRSYLQTIEAKDYERFETLTAYFLSRLLEYHNKIVNIQTGGVFQVFSPEDAKDWREAPRIYQWIKGKIIGLARILENPASTQYPDIITRAINYVYKNYSNSDLGMDMIAEQLGISANHLNTVFRRETGETLWKLVVRVRMERACELLSLGRDRMSDICEKTGYKNISYFSKVFKDTYGMTPMEYRREKDEN